MRACVVVLPSLAMLLPLLARAASIRPWSLVAGASTVGAVPFLA